MNQQAEPIGQVISADGTVIGYRQYGNGPGLILVHGGLQTSKNFSKLAEELADTYTVYIPDRRGRGLSGNHGNKYCLARECEDIQALMDKTGAYYVFGLSSGALIVLQSALTLPAIKKVALYEPPLWLNPSIPLKWADRYERELKQGKLAEAMTSILKGTADKWDFTTLPRFILLPLIKLILLADSKKIKPDEVPIKNLIPTFHFDYQCVAEVAGKIESYKGIKADVLLLGGSRSHKFLRIALDALSKVLPNSIRIEFPRIGHLASDNSGKPELVAVELKRFFGK